MTYSKINFVDRQVARPKTYTMTTNSDNTVTLTDAFGTIVTLGTPLNAENMNHMEDGIANAATVSLDNLSTEGEAKVASATWGSISGTIADQLDIQSSLDAKLDVTTYNENPRENAIYLKTTYVNGTSGYNIWSNGYCIQWGRIWSTYVAFMKTFANTDYSITFATTRSANSADNININNIWTYGFGMIAMDGSGIHWRAHGYLAEGQY